MKNRAFTLIELLVVIAIIALLISVVHPLIAACKKRARTVYCASNLRVLTSDMLMYEDIYGKFPYAYHPDMPPLPKFKGFYAGNACEERQGWWWFNFLYDAWRKTDYLKCPSKRKLNPPGIPESILDCNYGINVGICRFKNAYSWENELQGKPLSLADIRRPSDTVLIMDCGYTKINYMHVIEQERLELGPAKEESAAYLPGHPLNSKEGVYIWPDRMTDAVKGRHFGKVVNFGFPDGHVAGYRADTLTDRWLYSAFTP